MGPIVQAISGLTWTSKLKDQPPAGWGYSYMDHTGGYYMCIAILAALHHRNVSGEGQWVDMASTEAGATLTGPATLDYTANGRATRRGGLPDSNHGRSPRMSPHAIYPAAGDDRWIAIACRDEADWRALAAVVAEPWVSEERFGELDGRIEHEQALDERMAAWTGARDAFETAERLRARGVPAAAVARPEDRIEHDPSTAAWGLWPEVTHTEMGQVRVDGVPVHLGASDWEISRGAPCLGEHNEQVYGELLGHSAAEIDELRGAGRHMSASTPGGPMADLRVVELCDEAGALAGKLLADMGADVVKVEPPGGSRTRAYEPFLDDEPHPGRSLYFWHYNTSKRSLVLDLETEAGREAFRSLVEHADVLVDDQPPGRLAELGLDYESLRGSNPGLIQASITPFGQQGPRRDEPATDLTILAGGGPAWSCGYDDHSLPPVRGGGNQGFHTGCHWALIGILTALLHRDDGGEGQFIDVSMHAAANVTTEAGSYQWLVAGATVQRQTGRHAAVAPTGPTQLQAADGRWVTTGFIPRRPDQFETVIAWLRSLDLLDALEEAPLLEVAAGLGRHLDPGRAAEDETEAALLAAGRAAMNLLAVRLPAYEFFEGAQQRGFQVGIIYAPEQVIEDRHFVARGFPTEVEHPEIERSFTYPGAPIRFLGSPWAISRRPPLLGEHTDEMLAELGLSGENLAPG